ncbi:nucleotidyltransferase [Butyrivibrio sp. X503]|uniref:nucleotidyltransferase n=1 Tax=Butyrivibrio sp. X503 TaxID=2364878 RepID=UPI000EA9384B|nr:nucleotidyltransferase [Butyrivibrio sp. X503]RKM57062.1 nucleotidyltransferase [Butyrivibrio sp. X503]
MSTIGIIAEFNPFHNGHLHLINKCKELTGADKCIVIMSGDFVQRGAPALTDKFTRAKMALSCGADLVLELPVYYSTGSAEFFAKGAVSILDKTGAVDYLCFGSECGDIDSINAIAEILNKEPNAYKDTLAKELKKGVSFASAREKALLTVFEEDSFIKKNKLKITKTKLKEIISSPNNILAIEYVRALKTFKSKIKPFTVKREGEEYKSEVLSEIPSAAAIRSAIFDTASPKELKNMLKRSIPKGALDILLSNDTGIVSTDDFSDIMQFKLLKDAQKGFEEYVDVTQDISNKILKNLDSYESFENFCMKIKSKDITYSRISRCLIHILLDIKKENIADYVEDDYTGYIRILGQKASSKDLLSAFKKNSMLPVLNRLKDAPNVLNPLQMRLFEEGLYAGRVYNIVNTQGYENEYRLKPVIM